MKKFQILTHGNENLARAIQDKLYELGYMWSAHDKYWFENNHDHYAAYDDGSICNGFSYQRNKGSFGEFITLDELFAMTPDPKETIKIGDQTYDKAEFEKATENLKPIK